MGDTAQIHAAIDALERAKDAIIAGLVGDKSRNLARIVELKAEVAALRARRGYACGRLQRWQFAAEQAERWAAERKPERKLSEPVRGMSVRQTVNVAKLCGWEDTATIIHWISAQSWGVEAARLILQRKAMLHRTLTADDRIILSGGETS